MAEENIAKNIVKFGRPNFQLWKFQINTVLAVAGIRDVVTGMQRKPANFEDAAEKHWVKGNAKALSIIASAVNTSQLEYLISCTTDNAIWEKYV